MDRPDRNHHFQQHPRRAHDKPGAGEIRTRALECYNNQDVLEAPRQLLTLIEIGKMSQWPDFRRLSHTMEQEWLHDHTNLQSDNT
eukprot:12405654-Heterocapsa_arctica.AAC.1